MLNLLQYITSAIEDQNLTIGGSAMTAGTNLFIGALRSNSQIPDNAVFIIDNGTQSPQGHIGSSRDVLILNYQIMVRASTQQVGYSAAQAIWDYIDDATIPPFMQVTCDQSGPVSVGKTADDTWLYSINFTCKLDSDVLPATNPEPLNMVPSDIWASHLQTTVPGVNINVRAVHPEVGQVLTYSGANQAYWTTVSGLAGGASDHGELTGLADDDHPQYLTEARLGPLLEPLEQELLGVSGLLTGYTTDAEFNQFYDEVAEAMLLVMETLRDETNTVSGFLQNEIDLKSDIGHTHPEYDDTDLIVSVSGVLQTAIDDKADRDLSNLITTAINESLLPTSNNTLSLGSTSLRWANGYFANSIDNSLGAYISRVATGGVAHVFYPSTTWTSGTLFRVTSSSTGISGNSAVNYIMGNDGGQFQTLAGGSVRMRIGNQEVYWNNNSLFTVATLNASANPGMKIYSGSAAASYDAVVIGTSSNSPDATVDLAVFAQNVAASGTGYTARARISATGVYYTEASATANTPLYSFGTDTNSGIGLNAADIVSIVAGGSDRVLVSTTALTTAVNILPDADSTRNIGADANRYADIYGDNLHGDLDGGTIT